MEKLSPNTLIVVALVIFLLAVITAVVVPGLIRSRIGSGEMSPIGSLKTITTGQEQFKSARCIDLNGNNIGEYGFLEELGGQKPARVMRGPALDTATGQVFTANPFIPPVLGMTTGPNGGSWDRAGKSGYYFRVYLPTRDGATPTYGSPVDNNLAEKRYIAYAWPQTPGRSGIRVYVIDEQGMPYALPNTSAGSGFLFGGDRAPPFDAALKKSPGPAGGAWGPGIDNGGPGGTDGSAGTWVPAG